jgi:hypothetical protein
MRKDSFFCDNCAKSLPHLTGRFVIEELPCDIASANKGESALLCYVCYKECKEDYKC